MTDSSPALVRRPADPRADALGEGGRLRAGGPTRNANGPFPTIVGLRTAFPSATGRSPRLRGRHPWYEPVKRVVEFGAALVLLFLTAPVALVGAILVKLTSRGPAIYTQTRVGRYGRPFPIFKLRTMRHNCEAHSRPVWSAAGDPRITPIGRFLRRTPR